MRVNLRTEEDRNPTKSPSGIMKTTICEHLIVKDASTFIKLLKKLGMKFVERHTDPYFDIIDV